MLTPEQIESFRQRMEEQRDILRERIAGRKEYLTKTGVESDVADPGDDSVDVYEDSQTFTDISFADNQLAQIEKALARIEDGTYGFSEVSGQPIPVERLEALPWATTLVDEPQVAA